MKKIILSLGILFLAISQSTFAAVTTGYFDVNQDGQVDTVEIDFGENIDTCNYEEHDWTIGTSGSINITAVTGLSCNATIATLSVTADANITGGATDPVIDYTNQGTANSIVINGTNLANTSFTATDKAGPVVISFTPALNANSEVHVDEQSAKDATHGVVDVLLTEDPNGLTNVGADNGAFSAWGSNNHMYFEFRDHDDGNPRPDVDIPADDNGDGIYELAYNFVDSGSNQSQLESFKIVLDEINERPIASWSTTASIDENTTQIVASLVADVNDPDIGDTMTFSLQTFPATDDMNLFTIDPVTGEINFASAPDYENPQDANAGGANHAYDNEYAVGVRVTDTDGLYTDRGIHVTVNNVDEAPEFTVGAGDAMREFPVSVSEGQNNVMTVVAVDPEGVSVSYRMEDHMMFAPDSNLFSVDGSGKITFNTTPDYENPIDDNNDNVYRIRVVAEDATGHTESTYIHVTVTDIPEGHSGRSHSSSESAKKVCKDSRAINFNNVGQHDASLCKYVEEKVEAVKEKTEEKKEEKVEKKEEKVAPGTCSAVKEFGDFLRFGSRGQAVKDLQQFLNDNGFNAGKVDGIFGKLTRAAVKAMQSKFGITVDGIVGSETRGKVSCE